MSREPMNSITASWSSKWPTLRSLSEIMPRMAGISLAAIARRSAGASALRTWPPKAALPCACPSNQAMAALMMRMVVS